MKIKGIIVDVGGVLVQAVKTSKYDMWEKKLHLSPGQLTREIYSPGWGNSATIGLVSSDYIWQEFKKKYALSTKDFIQLQSDFYSGNHLNVAFYNYIKRIREKCKIVILSDAWDNARRIYTDTYHLDKIVDKMFLSAEEGIRKPEEKFIQLALDYLGISNQEALYIDDTLQFLLQAKLMGINTVFFTDTTSVIAEIEARL